MSTADILDNDVLLRLFSEPINHVAQLTGDSDDDPDVDNPIQCRLCGNQDIDQFKAVVNDSKTLIHVRCLRCDQLSRTSSGNKVDNGRKPLVSGNTAVDKPPTSKHHQQQPQQAFRVEKTNNVRNRRSNRRRHRPRSRQELKPPTICRHRSPSVSTVQMRELSPSRHSQVTPAELADSLSLYGPGETPAMPHSLNRRRIHDLSDLRPGDHIAFHRNYLVWHHAIVVESLPATSEITMIHYNGAPKKLDGKLISVRLETEVVDAIDQELYRYEYERSFDPQTVVDRAASRLGEADYGVGRNCEHFARWCKTGQEKCFQAETVKHRLIATGVSTLGKQLEEGVVSAARYLCKEAPEEIFRVGTGGLSYVASIQERALNLFSDGTSHMATGMKWGALAGNVTVNFIIEAANFGLDVGTEYTWYREGKISWDDFRQQAAKTGCECLGGLLGSTSGGLLLQLLIPIPFIGGFLGCALGNIFGRLLGAGIGKQLHKVKDV